MTPKEELVSEWLKRADDDLRIAELLMKDAVDSRYPAPRFEITRKKAEKVIEIAREIFEYILNALPDFYQE